MSSSIIPKTITNVFSTPGPIVVALAWTGDVLSRGQAQKRVNFEFEVKFDLKNQGQSPPRTIWILTKVFHTYGPNLVILAWKGDYYYVDKLGDGRTDGLTDRRRQRQYLEANTDLR